MEAESAIRFTLKGDGDLWKSHVTDSSIRVSHKESLNDMQIFTVEVGQNASDDVMELKSESSAKAYRIPINILRRDQDSVAASYKMASQFERNKQPVIGIVS
mmetsp:Transcript_17138/g.23098  ORF Transcript_17138/g.23098 Transcript_17138/m.23098 type:complete len:102 (+) Transcript_17138:149-454(+)